VIETAAVFLSLSLLVAALLPRHRRRLLWGCFLLLGLLTVSLGRHLLRDDFHYSYVWLYSAPGLDPYLKLASLWGGEQGTLLFFSLLLSGLCLLLDRYPGWSGPAAILLTMPFVVGLAIWSPFGLTTAAQFAHAPYQGMNAHLTKFWMAIHPPLIFMTYLLLLAPAGAAAEMLITGRGPWKEIALRYSRWAWVILTAGMVSGMWWAYEDYFYGQIWHWDPVQTASFVVWCFLTAYLHGLRGYHAGGAHARSLPFLCLLTAASAIGSMLVTRNGELVSSHRYLGESSVLLLALVSGALLLVAWGALMLSFRRRLGGRSGLSEGRLMIQVAIWGFVMIGAVGCYFLAEAYLRALMQLPKDKPPVFFALIANVSSSDLVHLLKEGARRWTVDNFGINQVLIPVIYIVAIFGGHRFLPVSGLRRRLVISGLAIGISFLLAEYIQPLEAFYDGTGVTSGATRRNFYLLDLLLGAVGYFTIASLLYALPFGVSRGKEKAWYSYLAPVGLIHMGVMLALFAGLCATILDSNIIRKVTFPAAYNIPIGISDHLSIQVSPPGENFAPGSGFREETEIRLLLRGSNRLVARGQTLYQDSRKPLMSDIGPIRQYCEAVDYRFARLSRSGAQDRKSHMLNPFIYRGIFYDLQVWLPATSYPGAGDTVPEHNQQYNIVIKKFPLMSLLWSGLVLSLLAGLYYAIFARRKSR